MARQEEVKRGEGRINLHHLSRGNLDSPLWENVQERYILPTGFPTGFFITRSLAGTAHHYSKVLIILNVSVPASDREVLLRPRE